MREALHFKIRILELSNGSAPYSDWLESLDVPVMARIEARIRRFKEGNFGDYKSVGDGVIEARIHFGAGYRVYYAIQGKEIVLLLVGGSKATQSKDIEYAKKLWKLEKEEE